MDVHIHTHHPGGLSGLIAEDAAASRNQRTSPSWRTTRQESRTESWVPLMQASKWSRARCLSCGCRQASHSSRDRGCLSGKPHHDGQFGRPEDAAAAQVYVKHTDLARFLRQLQALVDFAQRSLGLAGLGHVLDHPKRSVGEALHLQPAPRQPGVENTAIRAIQHGRVTHRFMRVQAWHDFGRNASNGASPPNRKDAWRPCSCAVLSPINSANAGLNWRKCRSQISTMGGALSKMAVCCSSSSLSMRSRRCSSAWRACAQTLPHANPRWQCACRAIKTGDKVTSSW